jgi:hypothetical protein
MDEGRREAGRQAGSEFEVQELGVEIDCCNVPWLSTRCRLEFYNRLFAFVFRRWVFPLNVEKAGN